MKHRDLALEHQVLNNLHQNLPPNSPNSPNSLGVLRRLAGGDDEDDELNLNGMNDLGSDIDLDLDDDGMCV